MMKVEKITPSAFDVEYSRYLGNLDDLIYFSERANRWREWLPRIDIDDMARNEISAPDLYRQLQEKRDALAEEIVAFETKYPDEVVETEAQFWAPSSAEIAQIVSWHKLQETLKFPATLAQFEAAQGPLQLDVCFESEGVVASDYSRYSLVDTPDDNDTEQLIYVDFPARDQYGRDRIAHKSYINDKSHWYKTDGNERYHYWAALRYEFPAPECPSMLLWEARAWHNVSLWGAAELRKIRTKWLLAPKPGQPPDNVDPRRAKDFLRVKGFGADKPKSVQDYFPYIGQNEDAQSTADSGEGRISGSYILEPGQRATIWLGIDIILTGREGTAASGWNHLYIQGVKYHLVPLA